MYFNYHAKAQNLIKTGHCTTYEIVQDDHKIKPCLVLFFDNHKPMPIRKHKFDEYIFLLAKFDVKKKQ